jgi:DNA-binding PadR family transcriptional regulator
MKTAARRSPLAIVILGLLLEAPMHPYEMQRLIKERGKSSIVNVNQRSSLYKMIRRLHRDGLIAVRETAREAQRPERTIYEVTPAGRLAAIAWLREMLATPREEFPEFPAAIASLPFLSPDTAADLLDQRRVRLAAALAGLDASLEARPAGMPRLVYLEEEYRRALVAAELAWVEAIIGDLRSGALSWDLASLLEVASKFSPVLIDQAASPGPTATAHPSGRNNEEGGMSLSENRSPK